LAKGRVQDKRSDIDLAVEGLPESVRDVTLGELRGRFRPRIDLIGIESTPAGLRSSVFRNRLLLPRVGPGLADRSDSEPGGAPRCELQPRLYQQRLAAVLEELKARGARRVIDLGCGGGWLIEVLARDGSFEAVTGVDMAEEVLRDTRTRLRRV